MCNVNRVHCGRLKQLLEDRAGNILLGNSGHLNDVANVAEDAVSLLGNNINDITSLLDNNNNNNIGDPSTVLDNINLDNSANVGNIFGNTAGNNNHASVAENTSGNNSMEDGNVLGNIATGVGNTLGVLNSFAGDIIDNLMNIRGNENGSANRKSNYNVDNTDEAAGVQDSIENKHNRVGREAISNVPTNIIQNIDGNINSIATNIDGITGMLVNQLLGSITDLTGCSKVEGEGKESALMKERKFLTLYMQLSEVILLVGKLGS